MKILSDKFNKLFLLSFILILLDQVTKITIKGFDIFGIKHAGLFYGQLLDIIGDTLQITYIDNEGMAFGISFGAAKIFLSIFSIIASIGLIIYLHKIRKFSVVVQLGIALILAGAVGNLIDRVFYGVFYGESALFYGKVVDFIQVDIPDVNIFGLRYTHFPVFNIADSCVTCGVILLLIFHTRIPSFEQIFTKKPEQLPDSVIVQQEDNNQE